VLQRRRAGPGAAGAQDRGRSLAGANSEARAARVDVVPLLDAVRHAADLRRHLADDAATAADDGHLMTCIVGRIRPGCDGFRAHFGGRLCVGHVGNGAYDGGIVCCRLHHGGGAAVGSRLSVQIRGRAAAACPGETEGYEETDGVRFAQQEDLKYRIELGTRKDKDDLMRPCENTLYPRAPKLPRLVDRSFDDSPVEPETSRRRGAAGRIQRQRSDRAHMGHGKEGGRLIPSPTTNPCEREPFAVLCSPFSSSPVP